MSISFSGSDIERISFAGQEVEEVWFEGVKIWPEGPTSIKDFKPDHLFLWLDGSLLADREIYNHDYMTGSESGVFLTDPDRTGTAFFPFMMTTTQNMKKGCFAVAHAAREGQPKPILYPLLGLSSVNNLRLSVCVSFLVPMGDYGSQEMDLLVIGAIIKIVVKYVPSSDLIRVSYNEGESNLMYFNINNVGEVLIKEEIATNFLCLTNDVANKRITGMINGRLFSKTWITSVINNQGGSVTWTDQVSALIPTMYKPYDIAIWQNKILSTNEQFEIYDMYFANYLSSLPVRCPLKVVIKNNTGIVIEETGGSYWSSNNEQYHPDGPQVIPAGGEGVIWGMILWNTTSELWLNLVYETTSNTKAVVNYTINDIPGKTLGSVLIDDITIQEYFNASFVDRIGGNVFTVTLSNPTT